MVLPSTDQLGWVGSRFQPAVRFLAVPPVPGTTQTSLSIPRPFEQTNATLRPSGDHAGELLCANPVGSGRTLPSETLTRYSAGIASSRISRFSVESCSNTMVLPSGDHPGDVWLSSPLVSWRGVPPERGTR